MFFNSEQTSGAVGAVVPEKSGNSVGPGASKHLSPEQFGKPPTTGSAEGGAAEGAAGAEGAGAAAEVAEVAPLLLL
jgi:hypothetical protein